MKRIFSFATAAAALMLTASAALADGELHIFNWGDYTSPDLIKKFEQKYNVKVTLDSYDSNETMISKVRAGNSGYDIVVPSDYAVKLMADDGLLEKTEPNKMENFKNMRPEFVNVYWDDGRHYSVPWQFGLTAFTVDTSKYKGDINTYAILFNTPDELKGKDVSTQGEASLKGHLKNGEDEKQGSQALPTPADPAKDKQLLAAEDILHGVAKASNDPAPDAKPAQVPN